VTYVDVTLARARVRTLRGPDARVRQVSVDLMRLVTLSTLWMLSVNDRTPPSGESSHFL
jgi:multisubunit Na+/H+ antiporter MnhF subunit